MEHILSTHWEDDNGVEWPIKVYFNYQPEEKTEYEDGHMVYPGCDSELSIDEVTRETIVAYDQIGWEICTILIDELSMLLLEAECHEMLQAEWEEAEDER